MRIHTHACVPCACACASTPRASVCVREYCCIVSCMRRCFSVPSLVCMTSRLRPTIVCMRGCAVMHPHETLCLYWRICLRPMVVVFRFTFVS